MWRSSWCIAMTLALAAALWGQNAGPTASQKPASSPSSGAAQLPPMAAPPTGPVPDNPTAATFLGGSAAEGAAPQLPPALRPNPNALRVFVQLPNGPDARQIAGLMQQYLFNSHAVVVTENASNASVILKGEIYRRPIAAAEAPHASAAARRRARQAAARRREQEEQAAAAAADGGTAGNGVSYISPSQIPAPGSGASLNSGMDADNSAGALTNAGYSAGDDDDGELGLPSMASLLNPGLNDLHNYAYRLDLELVNPDGDLVWISGRGSEAPKFLNANAAVAQSLQPMLNLLDQITHPPAAQGAKAH